MITKKCNRYGKAPENSFWIINEMPKQCYKELREFALANPDILILYSDCGTRPGKPIPIPETIIQVYTPKKVSGILLGWKVYQYGKEDSA